MRSLDAITEEITAKTTPEDRFVHMIIHSDVDIIRMDTLHKEKADFYLAYTKGMGASYRYKNEEDSQEKKLLLGRDFLDVPIENSAIKVALLDSIYAECNPIQPNAVYTVADTPERKIRWRSDIIAGEVKKLVGEEEKKILNVGVVDNIVRALLDNHYSVTGTDFNESIIGTKLFGCTDIFSGEKTLDLAAKSDLLVATGMTIFTETLDDIISVCKENNTKLIIYSETGGNLASYYIKNGVDAFISEVYPWYFFPGTSTINVYRAGK